MELINRQAAIDALYIPDYENGEAYLQYVNDKRAIEMVPFAQPEPLTDREQRIFLAAMGREEDVCKQVDAKYSSREPYEDSLVMTCHEIIRKVKGALWNGN